MAPPAAGGGRFVSLFLPLSFILLLPLSLSLSLSFSHSLVRGTSVGAALRTRYMRGRPPPSPSRGGDHHRRTHLPSSISHGASPTPSTMPAVTFSVSFLRERARLGRRCFRSDERLISPLLFFVLPVPLSCRFFLHRTSVPPPRSRASSLFVPAVVARSHGVSLFLISLDRNTRYIPDREGSPHKMRILRFS